MDLPLISKQSPVIPTLQDPAEDMVEVPLT